MALNITSKKLILLNLLLVIGLVSCIFLIVKKQAIPEIKASVLSETEIAQVATELLTKCQNSGSWHDCYKVEMAQTTKEHGLKTGVAILNEIQAKDQNSRNCHVISHFMSREALKRDPGNLDGLLDELDVTACGSGYLHGVLESYIGMHPEIELKDFAAEICERGTDYRKRMCAHFMGHVFLLNTEGDLNQAVSLCRQLKNEWHFDCLDGAFMEDHQKLALIEHEVAKQPVLNDEYIASMEKRCSQASDDTESRACWLEMAEMYAHTYGYIPEIIHTNCLRAKSVTDQRACYGKGIVVLSIFEGFDKPEKLKSICAFYKNSVSDEQWCVGTIHSSLVYYSPKFIDRGITACKNSSEAIVNWCLGNLRSVISEVIPDLNSRLNLCEALNEEDKQICKQHEI